MATVLVSPRSTTIAATRRTRTRLEASYRQTADADHLRETLSQFDPLWRVLHPIEQILLVQQVVEAVRYNYDDDTIRVTLRQ